jgi:hypothetical protein
LTVARVTARRSIAVPRATAWVALAGLCALTAVLVLYLGRSTGFYFDEWDFVLDRRPWSADALLAPHNEHLSVVPVLIYKAIFATMGIESYAPFRVAGVLVHLLVLVLLFVYARRRVGDLLALGATVVVALLGPAWPDVMWPFQSGFLSSLAAGLAALLALDRGDRKGAIAASLLLTVALASSSLGIPIFIAVAVEILGRPDRRARWPILVAPLVVYGLWYLGYGGGQGRESVDNLLSTPAYIAEAAAAAVGAVFGLGSEWGRPLAIALGVLLVLAIRRGAADPWRLAALIALPLVFWGLTGIARADLHEPGAPRYLYPGALFLLLIAVEAARGVRVERPALAALAVLVAFVTLANVGALRNGAGYLRDQTAELNGALAALQLAAPHGVPPDFRPQPTVAPQIDAGSYLAAVKDLGSPAPAPAELPRLFGRSRAAADGTLLTAYGIGLAPPADEPAGAPPSPEKAEGAETVPRGSCLRATPQAPASAVELVVPPAGLLLAPAGGSAKVFVRRFSDTFPQSAVGDLVAGGRATMLRIPSDASTAPWHARLALSGPVRVCALG